MFKHVCCTKVILMEENDEIKSIVSDWHSCHAKTFKVPQLVTESSLCKFANYFLLYVANTRTLNFILIQSSNKFYYSK